MDRVRALQMMENISPGTRFALNRLFGYYSKNRMREFQQELKQIDEEILNDILEQLENRSIDAENNEIDANLDAMAAAVGKFLEMKQAVYSVKFHVV